MDIYSLRAGLAKALAHPLRLRILDVLLAGGEMCVCDIVNKVDSSQSTVSKHLAVLKDAGIIDSRKDGLMVFYWVRTPCVREFFKCIDKVLKDDLKRKQAYLEEALVPDSGPDFGVCGLR